MVEEQQVVQRIVRARRLLLMGESADPAPDEIELAEALEDSDVPYVAVGPTVLRLPPILVWELVQQRANTRLLFLDKVAPQSCHYKTVEGDEAPGRPERITEVAELCSGRKRPAERVELRDGRHLAREWGERSRLIEETGARGEGVIPWDLLDPETIGWFVRRLKPDAEPPHSEIVCERLLDGRTAIDAHERQQLVLLFGKDAAAREELRRNVIDLQVISDPQKRWDDRLLIERANFFAALKQAIDFLAKHLGGADPEPTDLSRTDGPPDYLAMREALTTCSFIRTMLINDRARVSPFVQMRRSFSMQATHSTAVERLEEGGGHQARSPCRACAQTDGLRGDCGIWTACAPFSVARGSPSAPLISSDRQANSFGLRLSWRAVSDVFDELWLRRGIKVTPTQARIIERAGEPGGVTEQALADALDLPPDKLRADIRHLVLQALIEPCGERYEIAPHWRGMT